MEKMLIHYKRDKNNQPIGCVIAKLVPTTDSDGLELFGKVVFVTGSLCCKRDEFKKSDAIKIANGRINSFLTGRDIKFHPHSLKNEFYDMVKRAKKYFKGCDSVRILGESVDNN